MGLKPPTSVPFLQHNIVLVSFLVLIFWMVHKQNLHPELIQFRTRGINLLWTYLWHTSTNMCVVEIKDCKVTSFQKSRRFGSTSRFVNMLQNRIRLWWSPFFRILICWFFDSQQKGGETHWNPWIFFWIFDPPRSPVWTPWRRASSTATVRWRCRRPMPWSAARIQRRATWWRLDDSWEAYGLPMTDSYVCTPWKINGWNLQNHPYERKGKWSEPNLHDYVPWCSMLIFRGVWYI